MNAEGIKSIFAFTGNPIILSDPEYEIDWGDDDPGRFTVSYGGQQIFEGRMDAKLPRRVNVAEIADSVVDPIPEAEGGRTFMPICLEGQQELFKRRLYAEFTLNGSESEFDCYVLPGGVSKQNFRTYLRHGEDSFSARFLNPKGNFFLTTRTSGWCIVMKETEICPLYFVSSGHARIEVRSLPAGEMFPLGDVDLGIYALDLAAIRLAMFWDQGVIPGALDLYRDGELACRIVFERTAPAKEHYRVKFRNSLGVFDIIDVVGHARISAVSGSDDSENINRYDSEMDDFTHVRFREDSTQTVSIDSLCSKNHELTLLLDMLGSDEVYLLDVAGAPLAVIPTVEELTRELLMESPVNYTLTLEVVEPEMFVGDNISDADSHGRPRIFSDEFSKQFN